MESLEELELRIQELEKKSTELKQQRDKNKSNCCSEVCNIFKEELSLINQEFLKIDSKAYDRYSLYLKWYYPYTTKEPKDPDYKKIWEKHMKGRTRQEFLEHTFKSKEIRTGLIDYFYHNKKAINLSIQKENIEHLLTQLKLNNICRCED